MTTTRGLYLGMAAVGIAAVLAAWPVRLSGLALSEVLKFQLRPDPLAK